MSWLSHAFCLFRSWFCHAFCLFRSRFCHTFSLFRSWFCHTFSLLSALFSFTFGAIFGSSSPDGSIFFVFCGNTSWISIESIRIKIINHILQCAACLFVCRSLYSTFYLKSKQTFNGVDHLPPQILLLHLIPKRWIANFCNHFLCIRDSIFSCKVLVHFYLIVYIKQCFNRTRHASWQMLPTVLIISDSIHRNSVNQFV